MKKFRYRYDNILRLKERDEERVKNEMAQINALFMETRDYLELAKQEEGRYLRSVDDLMIKGCTASDLQTTLQNKDYLKKQIEKLSDELVRIENDLSKKKAELVEAMKEKKIYEKLKEKEFESFKENVKANEEKIIDQIVSYNSRNSGD